MFETMARNIEAYKPPLLYLTKSDEVEGGFVNGYTFNKS